MTVTPVDPRPMDILDGGAETTRTMIARTLLDLADRPDAWAALKAGAGIETAVEEFTTNQVDFAGLV